MPDAVGPDPRSAGDAQREPHETSVPVDSVPVDSVPVAPAPSPSAADGQSRDSGIHLVLRPATDDDTIEGVVEQDDTGPRPFHGWLELTSLLDRARPRPAESSAGAPIVDCPPVEAPPVEAPPVEALHVDPTSPEPTPPTTDPSSPQPLEHP